MGSCRVLECSLSVCTIISLQYSFCSRLVLTVTEANVIWDLRYNVVQDWTMLFLIFQSIKDLLKFISITFCKNTTHTKVHCVVHWHHIFRKNHLILILIYVIYYTSDLKTKLQVFMAFSFPYKWKLKILCPSDLPIFKQTFSIWVFNRPQAEGLLRSNYARTSSIFNYCWCQDFSCS